MTLSSSFGLILTKVDDFKLKILLCLLTGSRNVFKGQSRYNEVGFVVVTLYHGWNECIAKQPFSLQKSEVGFGSQLRSSDSSKLNLCVCVCVCTKKFSELGIIFTEICRDILLLENKQCQ